MHSWAASTTTPTPKAFEHAAQAFRNLGRHFFLNLKTLCIDVDKASELRDSNNAIAGKIANVDAADDRRHMMFAVRFELDVAQQHDLIVTSDFFEGSLQVFTRIFKITRKPFFISAYDATGCSEQSFAIRIVAGPTNESTHGIFGGRARGPICGCDRAIAQLLFNVMIQPCYFFHLIPA
jgi:hypothetical protein